MGNQAEGDDSEPNAAGKPSKERDEEGTQRDQGTKRGAIMNQPGAEGTKQRTEAGDQKEGTKR